MHQVIKIIVYAETKENALKKADSILTEFCESGTFDYFFLFNAGGEIPAVLLADSKEGEEMIKEAMAYTERGFMRRLEQIKGCIGEFSAKELFEAKSTEENHCDRDMFRFYCNRLGEYAGSSIWLYDNDGEGIMTNSDLNNALNKYNCIYEDRGKKNPYKNDKIWVVPADVHS